jgi:glycerophosphoryl diester phosphodiesterase
MYPQQTFYFAHRGGNEVAPENSLTSFLAAYDSGCRYLELDLRSTVDQQLVVLHDETLKRVAEVNVSVADAKLEELEKIKYPNGEDILSFRAFLDNIPTDAYLNIDPKTDSAARLLVDILDRMPSLIERVAVGTFSTPRIRWIRSQLPGLTTVASRNEVLTAFSRFLTGKTLNTPAKALQIPLTPYFRPHLRAEFAEYLHEHGLQVHVWTVNSLVDMQWLYARGMDAVMTDKPTIAQMYFDERQGK